MADAEKPRQLPLDLRHGPGFSRDDLVVSAANAAAVALIDRWPDWPAPVVVLAGPAGSGKSHLGAIWCEISSAVECHSGLVGEEAVAAAERGPVFIDNADQSALDERGPVSSCQCSARRRNASPSCLPAVSGRMGREAA